MPLWKDGSVRKETHLGCNYSNYSVLTEKSRWPCEKRVNSVHLEKKNTLILQCDFPLVKVFCFYNKLQNVSLHFKERCKGNKVRKNLEVVNNKKKQYVVLYPLILTNRVMVQLEPLFMPQFLKQEFSTFMWLCTTQTWFFHICKEISSFLTVIIVMIIISLNLISFWLWFAYIKWFSICLWALI